MSTISVIIPVYNGERFIGETIKSLLEQTRRADEIIVVDDGSTDRTADIVKQFGPQVTYYRQTNQGPSRARNFAIAQATGEYIAIQDADDRSLPRRLELQGAVLDKYSDIGVVYTDAYTIDEQGTQLNRLQGEGVYPYPPDFLAALLDRQIVPCTCNLMARRSCFLKVPYPEHMVHAEDYYLILQLARLFSFYYLSEPLYEYRRHRDNLTNKHEKQKAAEIEVVRQMGQEEWLRILAQSTFTFPERQMLLAKIWMKIEKYAEAVDALALVDQGDRNAVYYFLRGVCRYFQQQYTASKEDFKAAVALDEGMAEARNNLGCTLARLGEIEAARQAWQEAIRMRPDYLDAQMNLQSSSASRLTGKPLRKVLTPYRLA